VVTLFLLLACREEAAHDAGVLPGDDSAVTADVAAWTLLVYMAGDNSLEGYVTHDLDELEAGGADAQVRVLVQADRAPGGADDGGDWTGTRRYEIVTDDAPGVVSPYGDLGEVDMGDPGTLADFLAWGREVAPADHTALVLWNHGYAWSLTVPPPPSIAGDDTSGTELSIAEGELRAGLAEHVAAAGALDLLAFDACYMASWEVAHSLRDQAGVLVASEAWVGGEGLLYTPMLQALRADTTREATTIAADLATQAVGAGEMTFSAVDLGRMDDVATALDALAALALDDVAAREAVLHLRFATRTAEPAWHDAFLDLGDLARVARTREDPTIAQAGDALARAVDDAVLVAAGDDSHAWSTGLTIWADTRHPEWLARYSSGAGATWAQDTRWDEMLVAGAAEQERIAALHVARTRPLPSRSSVGIQ
jgi:hypothetical protein